MTKISEQTVSAPGCCRPCHGTGGYQGEPCSDCLTTGHAHDPDVSCSVVDLPETGDWLTDHERNDPRLVAIRAVLDEDGGTNWSSKVPRIRRILDSAYADADEIARMVPPWMT